VIALGNQMTLGEFMAALRRQDQDELVKFDFVHFGPTTLQSYRGYYEDVALGYEECGRMHRNAQYEYPKVRELLAHCEATIGTVFSGWKGGNGTPVSHDSTLWVANPGETGGTAVVGVEAKLYVTIMTALVGED
jgi:hypothetical protein